ncbi:MAG: 2-dehydropantoate 2-reductase [Salinisphaeraceae bacterium]|nr:2-dehydropantoate 2-reductase [Salinisphaeraceae bacterium]
MNLIIGTGAVGTILAAYLTKARHRVVCCVREEELADFEAASALRVERVTGGPPLEFQSPPLVIKPQLDGVRYVFICVKYPDLDSVLAALPEKMPEGITLVACMNGIGAAHRLRQRYPDTPVAQMTIMFNARLYEPLHVRITTRPEVHINTDDKQLIGLFNRSGMVAKRAEDESVAWGRLLISLHNAICAITHSNFKAVYMNKDLNRCLLASVDEAVAVLDHASIRYRLPVALPYPLVRGLLHSGRIAWFWGKLRAGWTEESYPSMVADIDRGNATEIDQLNGEIVRIGREQGVPTPVNDKIVELVHAMEGKPGGPYKSPVDLARIIKAAQQESRQTG